MIGMSGHYDPAVILLATTALYLHLSGKRDTSCLLLGLAFSLKYYTIVFLPFMLLNERRPLRRTVLFFLPMVLSWIPVLLIYPASLQTYLFGYQATSWAEELHKSFSYAAYWIAGAPAGYAKIIAYAVSGLTGLILIAYVLGSIGRAWHGDRERGLFAFLARLGRRPLGLEPGPLWAGIFAAVYFPLSLLLFLRFHSRLTMPELTEFEAFMMDLTLALLLFLYSSPNFAPWYLMWVLPSLLLISPRMKHILLLIIPWNFPGRELRPW
jgi:hypothetical protein